MNQKFLFFGYGANRNRHKMYSIIGHDPGEAVGAIIEDYELAIQTLNNIPTQVQEILKNVYGPSFKSYTLRKSEGVIGGVIWSLTSEDLEKLKEWEFVGVWREIVEVKARSSDGYVVTVLTEKSMDQFRIDEIADGLLYDELNFQKINYGNPAEKEYYTQKQIESIHQWLELQSKKR